MRKNRYSSIRALAALLAIVSSAAGCSDEPAKPAAAEVGNTGQTGLALGIEVTGDAKYVQFIVKRVACYDNEQVTPIEVVNEKFPAQQGDAGRARVDLPLVLPEGCYNVTAIPLMEDQVTPSSLCGAAHAEKIHVLDGFTTEFGLVSQCEGEKVGLADIYAFFNSPPVIKKWWFPDGKFTPHCQQQKVCLTFKDPNGDPVDLVWSQPQPQSEGGIPLKSGPTELNNAPDFSYDPATGETTQCALLEHAAPGTVAIKVVAYDLMMDMSGNMVRIEDYLPSLGLPNATSHDEVLFPSHGEPSASCPCVPNQFAEQCDLYDNDCDGKVNENLSCACIPFQVEECYTGTPGTEGKGLCHGGAKACKFDGSGFGVCQNEVTPKAETCNGLDDDCNDVIDNGFAQQCPITCVNGQTKACYTGSAATRGVGECHDGWQICLNDTWGACTGEQTPVIEIPGNQKDENCNGQKDELCAPNATQSCYSGQAGTEGKGICHGGTQTCQANGAWGACSGEVTPGAETCNGIDDDCDGTPDNGLGSETCGVGACQVTVPKCVNGQPQTCTPNAPGPEDICFNQIDDDCNGLVDDCIDVLCGLPGETQDCYTGPAGTLGKGICVAGTQTCLADGSWSPCQGEVLPAASETCGDQLDNDCNNVVDDSPPCPVAPAGVCAESCSGGTPDGVCDVDENSFNCASDCSCGDGKCSGKEDTESCAVDCMYSSVAGGFCGNGYCEAFEVNKQTKTILCDADCKHSEPLNTVCGDGTCVPAETATSCPADCGNLTTWVSGDGTCAQDEFWWNSVDCSKYPQKGIFLGAACDTALNSYALIEKYADGNGGTEDHVVTTCSESCGAEPWKRLYQPGYYSQNSLNGTYLLRPDCTFCQISGAPEYAFVGDKRHGYSGAWASVDGTSAYDIDGNPNEWGTWAYQYAPADVFNGWAVPVEWEKVSDKDCSAATCEVYAYDGTKTYPSNGWVGVWRPHYAPWSILSQYCQ